MSNRMKPSGAAVIQARQALTQSDLLRVRNKYNTAREPCDSTSRKSSLRETPDRSAMPRRLFFDSVVNPRLGANCFIGV